MTKKRRAVLELPLPPRFNFAATVESHGWYRLAPFRWDPESGELKRVEVFEEGAALDLTIRCDAGLLRVTSDADIGPVIVPLKARLRRMFQLDVDLTDFYRLCAKSRRHRRVTSTAYGRLLCSGTLFEDIVKIIATTNVNWSQTVRMIDLISRRCGRVAPSGDHAFPDPPDIARRSAAWLQTHCRLGYRASYVHQLARGITSGAIDLQAISNQVQPSARLFDSYRRLPGIGPYGAAHLLAMDGRHDFIAVDTEFRRFTRDRYFAGAAPTDPELVAVYEKWGRWKYLAYWSEFWESEREPARSQPEEDQ